MTYMLQKLNLCVTILHEILLYLQCNFLNALFKSHKSNKQSRRAKVFDNQLNNTKCANSFNWTGVWSCMPENNTINNILCITVCPVFFTTASCNLLTWDKIATRFSKWTIKAWNSYMSFLCYLSNSGHTPLINFRSCFSVSQPQLLLTWVCAEMWSFHNYYKQPQNYHNGRHIY